MFGLLRQIKFYSSSLVNRNITTANYLRQQINQHTPNNLEKRFLVWTKKYKSIDEVPKQVSVEVMERCRNRMRIRIANIMMALTAVGCIFMVISGKNAVGRGESVVKHNLDWHKKYNEDKSKEEASAKSNTH